jgi:hypothetical protein
MIAAALLGSLSMASADVVESFDPSVGILGNGLSNMAHSPRRVQGQPLRWQ